jgi:hypothetical protein
MKVEEVLEQLGMSVITIGREIACKCPFHADSHPSFSINAETGLWICYQCSRAGTLNMLIKEVGGGANSIRTDLSATEALREVRHKKIKKKGLPAPEPDVELPPDPLIVYARYDGFKGPPDWAIEERMISRAAATHYGLKWDRGWVLPIWAPHVDDESVALMGWQFKQMHFVSNYPKQIKKSHTLFGLRELGLYGDMSTVALVESPLDVVRLASANVAAVAAYGAFVSRAQLQLLVEAADRVLVALDNDPAGEEQAGKIYPYLARHVPTRRVRYPEGVKDPGDMKDEQVAEVFG